MDLHANVQQRTMQCKIPCYIFNNFSVFANQLGKMLKCNYRASEWNKKWISLENAKLLYRILYCIAAFLRLYPKARIGNKCQRV